LVSSALGRRARVRFVLNVRGDGRLECLKVIADIFGELGCKLAQTAPKRPKIRQIYLQALLAARKTVVTLVEGLSLRTDATKERRRHREHTPERSASKSVVGEATDATRASVALVGLSGGIGHASSLHGRHLG